MKLNKKKFKNKSQTKTNSQMSSQNPDELALIEAEADVVSPTSRTPTTMSRRRHSFCLAPDSTTKKIRKSIFSKWLFFF